MQIKRRRAGGHADASGHVSVRRARRVAARAYACCCATGSTWQSHTYTRTPIEVVRSLNRCPTNFDQVPSQANDRLSERFPASLLVDSSPNTGATRLRLPARAPDAWSEKRQRAGPGCRPGSDASTGLLTTYERAGSKKISRMMMSSSHSGMRLPLISRPRLKSFIEASSEVYLSCTRLPPVASEATRQGLRSFGSVTTPRSCPSKSRTGGVFFAVW